MGVISDSINLFNKDQNNNKDTIIIAPYGEMERNWPIKLPDGEQVTGHVDSYNRKTKVLKLSFTDSKGKKHQWELGLHETSEEKAKDEVESDGNEIPLFSVSGKLVYLTLLRTA